MSGWVPSLPDSVRRRNEIASLILLCLAHPKNSYWRARLVGALSRVVE